MGRKGRDPPGTLHRATYPCELLRQTSITTWLVAKLKAQTANAMEVVRTQQAAKERGALDEAALTANEVAGAPVKGTSAMVKSIFDSRRDGKDWKMVQRREQRKTQTGAGTAAQVIEGLETVAASAMEMYQKDGADALTVTDAHVGSCLTLAPNHPHLAFILRARKLR